MADGSGLTSLADMGSVAADAAAKLLASTIDMLPSLIAALLVFVLGWIIAIIISKIFGRILKLVKLEEFLRMHKLDDALGSVKLSDIFVKIVKIYVILVFLQTALSLVALGQLSAFLYMVILYVPVLIGAILVIVAAAVAGEYVKEKILELGKTNYGIFVARGAKFAIIVLGLITGLNTAGFDTSLLNSVLITIVQAVIFGLGLAFGIAFGLGGQDDAKDMVKKARKNLKV